MPIETRTVCKPDQHDFVPKRQKTIMEAADQTMDITEVFCRKCGTVCFLTTQDKPAESSRITLARSAN